MASNKQFISREDIGGGINRANGTREVSQKHWYYTNNFRFREEQRFTFPRKVLYDTLPAIPEPPVSPVLQVYVLPYGQRLVYQSSDLNYWDCTPNVQGVIQPTVLAGAPADPAKTDNLSFDANLSMFAFEGVDSDLIQLDASVSKNGWFLEGTPAIGSVFYTTDIVFTYASGYTMRFTDTSLNIWKHQMTDDGNLLAVIV